MPTTLAELHRELETPRPVAVQVDMVNGALNVTASGSGTTTVTITPTDPDDPEAAGYVEQARVEQEGDRLRVQLPHAHPFRRRHPEVRVELRVPEGSDLALRSAAVALTTDGPLRDVTVKTASGSVAVDVARGDLTVKSAAGDVEVGQVGGALVVKSASSRVEVGRAENGVLVSTAAGDVHLVRVAGDVHVAHATGTVRVDALGAGRARFETRMSDVEVGVLPGLDVQLDLHSGLGAIACDLEPSDGPGTDAPPTGVLELRASSRTGRVHVFASEL